MMTVAAAVWETTGSSHMTIREPFDASDGARLRRLEASLEVLDGLMAALTGVLSLRDAFDRVSEIACCILSRMNIRPSRAWSSADFRISNVTPEILMSI